MRMLMLTRKEGMFVKMESQQAGSKVVGKKFMCMQVRKNFGCVICCCCG